MLPDRFKIVVLSALLLCSTHSSFAQKRVIVSDSLKANSETLVIKTSYPFGFNKYPRFSFGEYSVISGKLSGNDNTTKGNLLGTKSDSETAKKFSFLLTDKSNDSVMADGYIKFTLKIEKPLVVSQIMVAGSLQQLNSLDFFANITLPGDTNKHWTLTIKTETGTQTPSQYESVLTDGKRTILITPTGTENYAKPTLGYQFTENGQFYAAFEYWGKFMLRANANVVWFNKSLDPKMKLVLSAAMVAMFQLKNEEQGVQ